MASFDDPVVVEVTANVAGYSAGMQTMAQQTQDVAAATANMQQQVDGIGGAAATTAKQVDTLAKSTEGTRRQVDDLGKSATSFMALARQVDDALSKEAKTLEDVTRNMQLFGEARKRGVMFEDEYQAAVANSEKVQQRLTKAQETQQKQTEKNTKATHEFSLASAGAQRELGVLAGELLRGNTAAFEKSLITLTRQTGALTSALGFVVSPLGLVLATILAGGAIIASGVSQQVEYSRSLIATGNAAGLSVGQLTDMAERVGATHHHYSEAAQALNELVKSGRVVGPALEDALRGSVAMAQVTGEEVSKTAQVFIRLAEDPLRSVVKLNEQYHFLTLSVYDQIKALEEQGQTQAAIELATKTLADAMEQRGNEMIDKAGAIERAWKGIKGAVADVIDTIKGMGRTDLEARLNAAYARQYDLEKVKKDFEGGGFWATFDPTTGARTQAELDAVNKVIAGLVAEKKAIDDANDAAAEATALNDGAVKAGTEVDALAKRLGRTTDAARELAKELEKTKLKGEFDRMWAANKDGTNQRLAGVTKDADGNYHGGMYDVLSEGLDKKYRDTGTAAKQMASDLKSANQVLAMLNSDISKGVALADNLAQEYRGPVEAAYSKFEAQINTLASAMDALEAKGAVDKAFRLSPEYARQWEALSDAVANAGERFEEVKAREEALAKVHEDTGTAVERLQQRYQKEVATIWMTDEARKAADDNLRIEKEMRQAVIQAIRDGHPEYADHYEELVAQAKAQAEVARAAQKMAAEVKGYLSIMESGTNDVLHTFTDTLVGLGDGWSNLGKNMVDTAKRMVSDILFQFLRLNVIKPFFDNLLGAVGGAMGGGSSSGGIMSAIPAGVALANGGGGNALGSGGTGAGDFTGGQAGGGWGNILTSGNSWLSAGKFLWSGFKDGFASMANTSGSSIFGTWMAPGSQVATTGNLNMSAAYANGTLYSGAPGTYTPSPLGYGMAIAGGVYAGYNRWQGSNKDVGGAMGAAAYGVGTYSAAIGAGAAMSGGMAAGFAAVPVVGWIALAAMAIDMISGGKLFGTSANKFVDSKQTLSIGASGADFANQLTLSGQRAFFGGKYYEDKTIAETEEQKKAAQEFFDAIKKQSDGFAKQFGASAGEIAAGSFTQHFDKNGKAIADKTETVINGKTYTGETQEDFAKRILSESFILDLKKVGVDVTSFTDKFIGDATKYANAVQDAAQAVAFAQQDMKKGIDLSGKGTLQSQFELAQKYNVDDAGVGETYARLSQEMADVRNGVGLLTGQNTIADIEAFLNVSQQFGETLSQTYQRLQAAAMTYRQTMQGVNEAIAGIVNNDPVSQFMASIYGISAAEEATTKTLNEAAKAAGLQGASEEDLAKVHRLAALQAQQAIATLQSAGASLVDSLYGTGTLGGINATIQAIMNAYGVDENGISTATDALGGFSNAITQTAQAATDAMKLLLGSLSPYNDQEKLQMALQGLREGTASREDVLQIAQRLYASSNAYRDIYSQVMAMPDLTKINGGGGYSGGGSSSSTKRDLSGTNGLTPEDLKDLVAQRDALQAQQRTLQANQLAAIVAQLSGAQQLSYEDVAKELNFSLEKLAKDLGVKLEDLPGFLDNLKKEQNKVPDTIVGQTDRVVDILRRIFTALTGQEAPNETNNDRTDTSDTTQTPSGGRTGGPNLPTGHSGRSVPGAGGDRSTGTGSDNGNAHDPKNAATNDAVRELQVTTQDASDKQLQELRALKSVMERVISAIDNNTYQGPRNLRSDSARLR